VIKGGFSSLGYSPQKRKYIPKPHEFELLRLPHGRPSAQKPALVLSDGSRQLELIDRNERRALSRRKSQSAPSMRHVGGGWAHRRKTKRICNISATPAARGKVDFLAERTQTEIGLGFGRAAGVGLTSATIMPR
jgi:hypothetical protein